MKKIEDQSGSSVQVMPSNLGWELLLECMESKPGPNTILSREEIINLCKYIIDVVLWIFWFVWEACEAAIAYNIAKSAYFS